MNARSRVSFRGVSRCVYHWPFDPGFGMDQRCRRLRSCLCFCRAMVCRGEFEKAAALPHRLKKEIEQFFLSTDFFTQKHPKIEAWKGSNAAEKQIRDILVK